MSPPAACPAASCLSTASGVDRMSFPRGENLSFRFHVSVAARPLSMSSRSMNKVTEK
uniref:Uncharacterized protein n=1 Tax=Physcomitrium patens TaxID=3218 RepID=A0A2K1J714_PHYPA|nr:hypothetical protein PHYPA_020424 [Physcomitrium patens]